MKFTNFNVIWKTDPLFESWLLADPKSKHSFKCKICQCTLDLGNMGRGALVKHNKSAKHIKNAEMYIQHNGHAKSCFNLFLTSRNISSL